MPPEASSTAPVEHIREVAESSWRWVLDQVRTDGDGDPWLPPSVPVDGQSPAPAPDEPPWDRDGLHSGIGGLALTLAEIRLAREWTARESALAEAITARLARQIPLTTDATFFDGLVATISALTALGDIASCDAAVARLTELATPTGWPQTTITGAQYTGDARVSDMTLGTAGVLLGAVWAHRHGVAGASELAAIAADLLIAEAEEHGPALDWPFVPLRYLTAADVRMPNLTHGLAGIATALALAGAEFGRTDLVDAAERGAIRLIELGDLSGGGFVVPRRLPPKEGEDLVTYSWCHGPTGTSLLFAALASAGVGELAGEPVRRWRERCLHSVRQSGIPRRVHPGFWDNDGRCCGTAGVADVMFDAGEIDFGLSLATTLVSRAITDETGTYWRFIEHRNAQPLLAPGTGWMQGASGIAAVLFRASRVAEVPAAEAPAADAVARLDNYWAIHTG